MKMEMQGGLALALVLGAATLGWGEAAPGERLAMTVELAKAFPGLGGVERRSDFFVDEEHRLVRIRDVTKGEYGGDPDKVEETVFTWDIQGVSWMDSNGATQYDNTLEYTSLGLDYRYAVRKTTGDSSEVVRKIHFTSIQDGVEWVDGRFSYSWKRGDGFQARLFPEAKGVPGWGFGYSTQGSRITQWTEKGFENNRILVNRTPHYLQGLFVVESESLTGWESIGTVQVSGAGLWSPNHMVMLANAMILNLRDDLAMCAPLVFEKNYLR